MIRISVIVACLMVTLLSSEAVAQADGQKRARDRGQRLKRLDADGDGRIARNEWKRKSNVFDRLDANGDGFVTDEELRATSRRRGTRQDRKRLAVMDKNSDGQISRDEWTGASSRFDLLDGDKNGTISAEEIKARRRGREKRSPGGRRFIV